MLFAALWTVAHQAPPSMGFSKILEWVAMPSSRGPSQPRDQTHVSYISCTGKWAPYHWSHLGKISVNTVSSWYSSAQSFQTASISSRIKSKVYMKYTKQKGAHSLLARFQLKSTIWSYCKYVVNHKEEWARIWIISHTNLKRNTRQKKKMCAT